MSLLDGPKLRPAEATAALIVTPDGRYLLQHRDDKPEIFWPGYWGCFGGGLEPGETPEICVRRELIEEIGFNPSHVRHFSSMQMDWSFAGYSQIPRHFFEVSIVETDLAELRLGEGQNLGLWTANDILTAPNVIPYDATVIWMHAAQARF